MAIQVLAKWIGFAVVAALFAGCAGNVVLGSGRVTTETRQVSNFDGIALSGFGDLTFTQGDSEALTVEAEDNFMPYLKSEVSNGTLILSVDSSSGRTLTPTKPIRYTLSVKNLKSIDLSGAGRISSASLKSDQLSLGISGAGSIDISHVEATGLTCRLSGAGNLKVAGQVTSQTVTLSGLGSYDAGDLASQSAKVVVSGAGGAAVWVRDNLDVTISGAGGVNYYGSPQIQQKVTGVGGVKSLGNK